MKQSVLENELRIILNAGEKLNSTTSALYASAVASAIPEHVLLDNKILKKELRSLSRAIEIVTEQIE